MRVYMYTCIYIYTYLCVCVCLCIYIYICVSVCGSLLEKQLNIIRFTGISSAVGGCPSELSRKSGRRATFLVWVGRRRCRSGRWKSKWRSTWWRNPWILEGYWDTGISRAALIQIMCRDAQPHPVQPTVSIEQHRTHISLDLWFPFAGPIEQLPKYQLRGYCSSSKLPMCKRD